MSVIVELEESIESREMAMLSKIQYVVKFRGKGLRSDVIIFSSWGTSLQSHEPGQLSFGSFGPPMEARESSPDLLLEYKQ